MLNLIDQSNIIKGLDDATLQREMAQPSGTVPPFLLLSEISRRKDMRQRYAGQIAKDAPKTTVAQDVMSAPAMPGMPPGGAPAAPGGLAAAAQMGGGAPPTPGFASGGLVDAGGGDGSLLDYGALAKRYQSDLNALPADKNQAQALALLAAGAGIMGGGHSNLGQNLGAGINAGITNYTGALNTETARQTNDLRGLADLATASGAHDLSQLQYQLDLRKQQQAEDPNSVANTPQAIREAQMINAMPDGPDKDAAMAIASPFSARMQSQALDPATLKMIADRVIAGDKSAATGYGRNPAMMKQIADAVTVEANAQGLNGAALAANFAAYAGNLAGQRTAGVKGANVSIASDEATQMADIALEASKNVPRGSFVPWNQAMNAVASNTSSPALAKFVTATTSLVNAYARAVSPVGVSTDAARQHAYDMLNVAQGPDAYEAVIEQMKKEMEAALSAPKDVSDRLKKNITGDTTAAPPPIAADAETNALVDKWLK